MYLWLEALFHLPFSLWAIPALLRDSPHLPPALLVFAVQTAVTTLTCIADYRSWSGFSDGAKGKLDGVYVPYLALAVCMGGDMFLRLVGTARRGSRGGKAGER
ncbi:hypothetical protein W97_07493 [Coniosporium apollinis CBS 100218]|uniref:EXPERA domain-containing protein n=1 Tax=Coniosporium apollinis (strain CBS 100218) TaxID=1168221 RepID=R7Z214_CONA1|nr:uncharacterized protein W97_07493 [Coniosporium apollinis CBS 100218]EON68235.1 hypothetical protein W97_07493 [Coniosporium apollinis CBS 100218]